jgi:hypothetical protein
MYLIGFLFGLGFDTATEVASLGICAREASTGIRIWSKFILPTLFTAGMALIDTTGGVRMPSAYRWAFVKPLRKLCYNRTITFVSVLVALLAGGIEILGLVGDRLKPQGRLGWRWRAEQPFRPGWNLGHRHLRAEPDRLGRHLSRHPRQRDRGEFRRFGIVQARRGAKGRHAEGPRTNRPSAMTPHMKLLLTPFILIATVAGAQDAPQGGAPVQMAPVTVNAGPLGFIGIRCSASVGMFGLISNNAHIRDLVIVEVFRDSAAQRAGLLAQDRVLRIDGVPITDYSINGLKKIGEKEKGDAMELQVIGPSAQVPRTVQITLGARRALPR